MNVKATEGFQIFGVELRQCSLDATYTVRADMLPPRQVPARHDLVVAHQVVIRGAEPHHDRRPEPNGATIPIKVGAGSIEWQSGSDGSKSSLTCDPDHPCALVAQIATSTGLEFWTTSSSSAPTTRSPGAAVPRRASWRPRVPTRCRTRGARGATRHQARLQRCADAACSAVKAWPSPASRRGRDLAYTSAGYDAAVGLGPTDTTQHDGAPPHRAQRCGDRGGRGLPPGHRRQGRVPAAARDGAQMAALFAGGVPYVIRDDLSYKAGILNRNPSLGGSLFATVPTDRPMAPSEAESSSWYMTNYFTKFAAPDWISPRDDNARPA